MFLKHGEGKLQPADSLADADVASRVKPDAEERAILISGAGIPEDFVLAAADRDKRPRPVARFLRS